MQAKLREAAILGRKDDITELLKHDGVDVNSADGVSHVIRLCMSEGVTLARLALTTIITNRLIVYTPPSIMEISNALRN